MSKNQKWIQRSAMVCLGLSLGCAPASSPNADTTATQDSQSSALVVFHTSRGVFTAKKNELNKEKLKQVIENFYPAACIDDDADGDRSPDGMDDDSDDCESRDDDSMHSSMDLDGGSDDSADVDDDNSADSDDDDIDDAKFSCKRCNRGPGTEGDFRLEVEGTHAKLDRGHVIARAGNQIQVAGPQGPITINIDANTELKGGEAAPGAEIRAEGQSTGSLIFTADKLEVLCPAPGEMPAGDVPTGAEPVPPTSTPPAPTSDAGVPGIN